MNQTCSQTGFMRFHFTFCLYGSRMLASKETKKSHTHPPHTYSHHNTCCLGRDCEVCTHVLSGHNRNLIVAQDEPQM